MTGLGITIDQVWNVILAKVPDYISYSFLKIDIYTQTEDAQFWQHPPIPTPFCPQPSIIHKKSRR